MNRKRFLGFIGAGVIIASLFPGCEKGAPKGTEPNARVKAKATYISIATSSAGGAFAIIGTAMADVINKNLPQFSTNIEITGGSSENILLAAGGSVELAMTASDVLSLAKEGKGSFEGKKVENTISGVMGGHMVTTQIYVVRDGPIKTIADLKNKKIGCGPSGSTANDAMKTIMDAYGFEINKDWQPEYLSHGDAAEALTDGNIDAVIIISTLPASPVTSAAASKPVRLLDIDADKMEKILSENPHYIRASIPANVYKGQDTPVDHTFGSVSMMITQTSMPEDDIYNIVKALFENNDALVRAYPQCNEWNVQNATRGFEGILEMHPGAIKYLKEIGAWK